MTKISDETFAKLESMKEFPGYTNIDSENSVKNILAALQPGVRYWTTQTDCVKPENISYEMTATDQVEENQTIWINNVVSDDCGLAWKSRDSISDIQNSPGKAVFLSLKRAEEYYKVAVECFKNDIVWQASHQEFKDQMGAWDNDDHWRDWNDD